MDDALIERQFHPYRTAGFKVLMLFNGPRPCFCAVMTSKAGPWDAGSTPVRGAHLVSDD